MNTEREVARQRPWRRRPGNHADAWIVEKREGDDDGGILHLLVGLSRLEVRQRCAACGRERHNLKWRSSITKHISKLSELFRTMNTSDIVYEQVCGCVTPIP